MQTNIMQLNVQPVVKTDNVKATAVKQKQTGLDKKQGQTANTLEQERDFKDVLAAESSRSEAAEPAVITKPQEQPETTQEGAAIQADDSQAKGAAAAELLAAQLLSQNPVLNEAEPIKAVVQPELGEAMLTNLTAESELTIAEGAELLAKQQPQDTTVLNMANATAELLTDAAELADAAKLNKVADVPLTQPTATAASSIEQSISQLVGKTEVTATAPVQDNRETAIRNLDFLSRRSNAGETEAALPTVPVQTADVKTAKGSELTAAVNTVQKSATELKSAPSISADSGVLTDEQAELELANTKTAVTLALPRAVTAPESSAKIVASLSDKLQALNAALGIADTEPDTVFNSRLTSGQPLFAEAFNMADNGLEEVNAAENKNNAAGQTAADYDIPKQIVEQARLFRTADASEMVIKLKPEHLGELTLKVMVGADGTVSASFRSDNPEVRGAIENSIAQLRQELQQQGLKVDNIDVDIYSGQELFGGEGGNAAQQQDSKPGSTVWNEPEEEDAAEPEGEAADENSDSVDYLV